MRKVEVDRLDRRAGDTRSIRQKGAIGLRSWTDKDTGMVHIKAEYDPESGLLLLSRIDATSEALFHDTLPEHCPQGDAKFDHLRALSLLKLVEGRTPATAPGPGPSDADADTQADTEADTEADSEAEADAHAAADVDVDVEHAGTAPSERSREPSPGGTGSRAGSGCSCQDSNVVLERLDNRCEMIIVIDLDTLINGLHTNSIIDNGYGIDLPVESYRRMACNAAIIPIVLDTNGVAVDQGRTTRLANRAQRRHLRAMYTTCAIPGCTVSSRHCQPHHIRWWTRDHGPTDIDNLLPLCSRHHHAAHEGGWQLALHPNRSLTITYPDGTIRTTGPPATQRAA